MPYTAPPSAAPFCRGLLSAAALTLGLASTGCISEVLTNGQIAATRQAAVAVNTIADYELQRSATQAGLAQFEGMHLLAPNNKDALFLLTQAWGGYAYAFVEDEYDEAIDKNDDNLAEYQKKRARLAYDRAVFYGLELLGKEDGGFEAARRNADTMNAWLTDHFKSDDDAANLFWTGYAWLSRVNLYKDDPVMVADLFVGVDMMEHSVAIKPDLEHWSGTIALAAYHARPAGDRPVQADVQSGAREDRTQKPPGPAQLRDGLCVREGRPRALREPLERGPRGEGSRPGAASRQHAGQASRAPGARQAADARLWLQHDAPEACGRSCRRSRTGPSPARCCTSAAPASPRSQAKAGWRSQVIQGLIPREERT